MAPDSKMLSRPSFSIRWFVPQRKSGEVENGNAPSVDHTTEDSAGAAKSQTWPRGIRKGPVPTIDIRRSEDIHRIVVLPPLPDTPKSWCSSVYSCDDEAKFVSPRSSPTPSADDRSRQRSPGRAPQRSPLLTPQQLELHRRPRSSSLVPWNAPPLLPSSPPSSPRSRPRQDSSPVPLLDPAEDSLSAGRSADEPTPIRWTFERGSSFESQVSIQPVPGTSGPPDDIEQLIRETDEAFRLWQSSPETILPSPPSSTSGAPESTRDSGLVRRASLARRTSQRSTHSSVRSTKPPTKPAQKSPLLATQGGQASVSRTKKARFKKSGRRPRGSVSWPTPRWTLTESAKDLFTIRIFNRIEADEMLPESVLQEIRMSRATQARLAREAAAADRESGADASAAEPDAAPAQEFPAHAGAGAGAGAAASAPMIIRGDIDARRSPKPTQKESDGDPAPPQPAAQQPRHIESPVDSIDSTAPYKDEGGTLPRVTIVDDHPPSKARGGLTPPQLKSQCRRSATKQMAPLPTIPEVIAIGAETFLSPTSRGVGGNPRSNTEDYIFLPATSYTFNMPTFRHGSIRLSKADLPIGKLAAAVDDTLDWTAFQMAILGGAGDFFGESTDYSRPSDAELAERGDVASWFAGFGFEGPGMLVSAADALAMQKVETPPARPATPPNPISRAKTPLAELEVKEPPQAPRSPRVDLPEYFLSTGIGLGQEGVTTYHNFMRLSGGHGAHSRPRSGFGVVGQHVGLLLDPTKRGSLQSLPPSPMLDMVVSHDVDGNEYVVPMGFNLGHDLGDFLKWEAENVFGGGYYGPDPA